ncbi:hypothetical protein J1605_000394 [Eschrichtius robustus]|uniref:Uncharacterized protein n=1 Tax=Eschrichtius robustus TaxID=9764 RepID=A0AB34HAL3_ESCRO|nr:hypothetical protein J1605_000394 [Eschrichtius robustus]
MHVCSQICLHKNLPKPHPHAKGKCRSYELKKEVDDVEIEINYLNQQIARLYEMKNLSETLEEENKNIEKRKESKERYK